MFTRPHSHPFGIVRREFLRWVLGLPGAGDTGDAGREGPGAATVGGRTPSAPRAKSMILVFLTGGLSHLDSFDMKPTHRTGSAVSSIRSRPRCPA